MKEIFRSKEGKQADIQFNDEHQARPKVFDMARFSFSFHFTRRQPAIPQFNPAAPSLDSPDEEEDGFLPECVNTESTSSSPDTPADNFDDDVSQTESTHVQDEEES